MLKNQLTSTPKLRIIKTEWARSESDLRTGKYRR